MRRRDSSAGASVATRARIPDAGGEAGTFQKRVDASLLLLDGKQAILKAMLACNKTILHAVLAGEQEAGEGDAGCDDCDEFGGQALHPSIVANELPLQPPIRCRLVSSEFGCSRRHRPRFVSTSSIRAISGRRQRGPQYLALTSSLARRPPVPADSIVSRHGIIANRQPRNRTRARCGDRRMPSRPRARRCAASVAGSPETRGRIHGSPAADRIPPRLRCRSDPG